MVNELEQMTELSANMIKSNRAMIDRLSKVLDFHVQLVPTHTRYHLIKVRRLDDPFFDTATIKFEDGQIDVIDYSELTKVDVYIFIKQLRDIPSYGLGYYSSILPHQLIQPFHAWIGGLDCRWWFGRRFDYFHETLLEFGVDISKRFDGVLPNA